MTDGPITRRGAWTLVATGLGLFMIFLDALIVNVAIPDIQRQFSAGESGLQWVVAAYSLTMAMFMMSGGTFGDHYGRRLGYIVGIVVFCLASVACGLAPSIAVLIAARGFQGIGAALVNVASLAIVSATFSDPQARARAIGIWTGIAAVGLAIGPTLGGVLTENVGWRSIFLLNPVVGIIAVVLTLGFVSESRDPASRSFDVPGQLLFISGIGVLTYALIQGGHDGWLSPVILGSFAVAAVVLVLFVRYELRASDPMMDVHVFRNRVYDAAIYAAFATLFCVYGAMFIITQYFQNVRGYSPETTGLLLLAMTIPTIILSPLTGRIVAARGARTPTLIGLASLTIGIGILAASDARLLAVTLVALAFVGTAAGTAVAAATSEAMGSITSGTIRDGLRDLELATCPRLDGRVRDHGQRLRRHDLGHASGQPRIPHFRWRARQQVVDRVVDDANPHAIAGLIGPGKPLPQNVTEDDAVQDAADDAFVTGIRVAMVVGLLVSTSSLVVSWLLFPRRRDPSIEQVALEPG